MVLRGSRAVPPSPCGFAGSPEIRGSEELYRELALDPTSYVSAPVPLRARLRARRDGLLDLADAWFDLQAREVDAHGTAGVDVFRVVESGGSDGEIVVEYGEVRPAEGS